MSTEIDLLLRQADQEFNPVRDRAFMPLRGAVQALDRRLDALDDPLARDVTPVYEAVKNLEAKAASYDVKLRLDAADRELLRQVAASLRLDNDTSLRAHRLLCRLAETPVESDEHARMEDEGGYIPPHLWYAPDPQVDVEERVNPRDQRPLIAGDTKLLYWNNRELKRGLRIEIGELDSTVRVMGRSSCPPGWYTIVGVDVGAEMVQVRDDSHLPAAGLPHYWISADRIVALGKIVEV
jgi:hypothetical protein